MNFNANSNALTSKLSRAIFFLNRVKHTLTPKALKSLYISFFHSHLLYCTNIYSCTFQTNINKIFLQQKKAIRIITNSSYTAHTAPLFARLNILPLEKVITHAKLSFMHTVYYGTAPTSFNNIWQTQAQRHPELNLRNATDIYVPFPRIDLFTHCLPSGTLMTLYVTTPIELSSALPYTNSCTPYRCRRRNNRCMPPPVCRCRMPSVALHIINTHTIV
jgi:hypothetical protein